MSVKNKIILGHRRSSACALERGSLVSESNFRHAVGGLWGILFRVDPPLDLVKAVEPLASVVDLPPDVLYDDEIGPRQLSFSSDSELETIWNLEPGDIPMDFMELHNTPGTPTFTTWSPTVINPTTSVSNGTTTTNYYFFSS